MCSELQNISDVALLECSEHHGNVRFQSFDLTFVPLIWRFFPLCVVTPRLGEVAPSSKFYLMRGLASFTWRPSFRRCMQPSSHSGQNAAKRHGEMTARRSAAFRPLWLNGCSQRRKPRSYVKLASFRIHHELELTSPSCFAVTEERYAAKMTAHSSDRDLLNTGASEIELWAKRSAK